MAEKMQENKVVADSAGQSDSETGAIAGHINETSLLRKIDRHLLPAVGILYLMSFLDRSNGVAKCLLCSVRD